MKAPLRKWKKKFLSAAENDLILPKGERREKFLCAAYLFFIFILCFVKLRPFVLPQLDDLTHAAMGVSILQTGDWFTMHEGRIISWLKPPLYFWMEAILFRIFGVSEYWAKFPSAALGFLAIFFTYKTVLAMFNRRIAFLALFVISTSVYFMSYTQRVMLDMPVTFAIILGIFAVVSAERKNNPKYYYLFAVSAAAGYYFKGAQGLYILPIIYLYLLFSGQKRVFLNGHFIFSNFLTALLILLWAAPQYLTHGESFLYSQSGIGPLVNRGLPGYENAFFNPCKNLLRMHYWTPVSAVGMWLGIKMLKRKQCANGIIMLFVWFFLIMSALSVSKVFGVRYLIPAMVPSAVFSAITVYKFIGDKKFIRFQHLATILAAAVLILTAVLPGFPPKKETPYISLYRSVNTIVPKNEKIFLYKERQYVFNQGLTFYCGRPLDGRFKEKGEIEKLLRQEGSFFAIANPADYIELAKSVPAVKYASSVKWVLFKPGKNGYIQD